ncbi:MAG: prepilin-type N-terminal cleavage/methylation domain-containing protein [Kofleriaceae bacterium]|nr:prepilin-type N-terminal cleavage/methylation domain-containing protein [Myxococcales bacterium]MCB9560959.1 prepilin-type N-terminal cleavage/methylation domain-containing protein [Kofleriaceae bacterium]MCB9574999.1 prepilin-type N-terminal cleavage/methylation domain-containing protein [Kofleriaceae bacterium]
MSAAARPRAATARRGRAAGFTLIEVMAALAILSIGLTWMLRSTANSVRKAEDSRMASVVIDLARGKMYDVEEALAKDGFQETEQSSEGDFEEEGWPQVTWKAVVEKVELPSLDQLTAAATSQATAAGAGSGSGTGAGSDDPFASADSGGGLLGMLAFMGGGVSAEDVAGGSFLASQYQLIQQVLEVSVRKVILTVSWKVLGRVETMDVVAYFTDPGAMNQAIGGFGGAGAGDYGTDGVSPTSTSSGSGTGTPSSGVTGRGSTTTRGTRGGK